MSYKDSIKLEFENELEPHVKALGYILVDASMIKRNENVSIKIVIHSETGVGIDDCVKCSKYIDREMDFEGKYGDNYTLEVSSPGLGRNLKTIREYRVFAGRKVKANLRNEVNGKKSFTGIIKEVEDEKVDIEENGETVFIELENISKCRLFDDIKY
jgi:ribosome maturation factor RimP